MYDRNSFTRIILRSLEGIHKTHGDDTTTMKAITINYMGIINDKVDLSTNDQFEFKKWLSFTLIFLSKLHISLSLSLSYLLYLSSFIRRKYCLMRINECLSNSLVCPTIHTLLMIHTQQYCTITKIIPKSSYLCVRAYQVY